MSSRSSRRRNSANTHGKLTSQPVNYTLLKPPSSIDHLTYSLQVILRNIEMETGMVASVIYGGYDPRVGKLSVCS